MKVFQIVNNICHWDASSMYESAAEAAKNYAPDVIFVDAPNYVEEGYIYENGEFSAPKERAVDEIAAKKARVEQLKSFLFASDYKAIKYAEGFILEKEYSKIKAERQAMRDEINRLEAEISRKKAENSGE